MVAFCRTNKSSHTWAHGPWAHGRKNAVPTPDDWACAVIICLGFKQTSPANGWQETGWRGGGWPGEPFVEKGIPVWPALPSQSSSRHVVKPLAGSCVLASNHAAGRITPAP